MLAETSSSSSGAYFQIEDKENYSPLSSGKSSQWGPLFKAVLKRDSATLNELLIKGIQSDISNDIGETPLLKAVENGFEEIVEILLKYGANPNGTSKDEESLASISCANKNLRILDKLVEKGANLNKQNNLGNTCLHIVSETGEIGIIAYLLDHNVDRELENKAGKKALEVCTSESARALFYSGSSKLSEYYRALLEAEGEKPEENAPFKEVSNFALKEVSSTGSLQKKSELISKQISPERKNEDNSVDQIELKIFNNQPEKPLKQYEIPEDLSFVAEKAIFTWLQEISLDHLMQNFMDNAVYENITLLKYLKNSNDWNKCLITLFGIDKPGHRFRISLKVKDELGLLKRKGLFSRNNPKLIIKFPSMEDWLNSVGLVKTFELFEQSGFDDYESLLFSMTMPEECLDEKMLWEEIGIEDPDQRNHILSRLMEDATKAAGLEIPAEFEGEITFECSGKRPPNLRSSCKIF